MRGEVAPRALRRWRARAALRWVRRARVRGPRLAPASATPGRGGPVPTPTQAPPVPPAQPVRGAGACFRPPAAGPGAHGSEAHSPGPRRTAQRKRGGAAPAGRGRRGKKGSPRRWPTRPAGRALPGTGQGITVRAWRAGCGASRGPEWPGPAPPPHGGKNVKRLSALFFFRPIAHSGPFGAARLPARRLPSPPPNCHPGRGGGWFGCPGRGAIARTRCAGGERNAGLAAAAAAAARPTASPPGSRSRPKNENKQKTHQGGHAAGRGGDGRGAAGAGDGAGQGGAEGEGHGGGWGGCAEGWGTRDGEKVGVGGVGWAKARPLRSHCRVEQRGGIDYCVALSLSLSLTHKAEGPFTPRVPPAQTAHHPCPVEARAAHTTRAEGTKQSKKQNLSASLSFSTSPP